MDKDNDNTKISENDNKIINNKIINKNNLEKCKCNNVIFDKKEKKCYDCLYNDIKYFVP
jgi:hypothetical protein